MSYTTIAEQIVLILQQVQVSIGVTTEALYVLNHEPKELGKYPCATVSASGHNNQFNDTAGNKRKYMFMVRIYARSSEPQASELLLRKTVDDIITRIESNVSLNGSCEWAKPTEGTWGYQEREVPVRVVELKIEASKRVLR